MSALKGTPVDTKPCTRCGIPKALEEFNRRKRSYDGRRPDCRSCEHAYYRENRDARREQQRSYYQENRVAKNEYDRAYRQTNRTAIRDQQRVYYQANRDAVLARARVYKQANAEYWSDRNPYLEHPTGKKECRRKHGELPVSRFPRNSARPDGLHELCRECGHANGETAGDKAAWTAIARTRPPCIYCGDTSAHIDHVHPVSRGGRDIALNYAPACEYCNTSKHAKWVYDYLFGTTDRPDTEKPTAYQSWDASFLVSFFAELEHPTDARP